MHSASAAVCRTACSISWLVRASWDRVNCFHGQQEPKPGIQRQMFFMAAALDPNLGFRWLQDHPGTTATKNAMKKLEGTLPTIYFWP